MNNLLWITAIAAALVTAPNKRPDITKASITNPVKSKWIKLFDGKTTNGWKTYAKDSIGSAWKVQDGILYLDAKAKKEQKLGGGDIIHEKSFGNFHLKLEWKISKNGNSGIIFWAQNDPAKYKAVWHTGPEMQVLDNGGHPDAKIRKHRAGDLYDLVEGPDTAVKPVGEWNKTEIIAKDGTLELKLNGVTTVKTSYGDEIWYSLIGNSKFKTMPAFGRTFTGHIALQDHGDDVWFRNIQIREL
ncbi:MAG: glycosyl hydrolase [Sphingobacteriia bacterium 28-36-52]|nr:MAG: glycosyl hydrolase [Sphingobacteriia bacterium 28-36-52]